MTPNFLLAVVIFSFLTFFVLYWAKVGKFCISFRVLEIKNLAFFKFSDIFELVYFHFVLLDILLVEVILHCNLLPPFTEQKFFISFRILEVRNLAFFEFLDTFCGGICGLGDSSGCGNFHLKFSLIFHWTKFRNLFISFKFLEIRNLESTRFLIF